MNQPPVPPPRSTLQLKEPQLPSGSWGRVATPSTCSRPALASAILVGILFLVAFLNAARQGVGHLAPTPPSYAVDAPQRISPQPER